MQCMLRTQLIGVRCQASLVFQLLIFIAYNCLAVVVDAIVFVVVIVIVIIINICVLSNTVIKL